MPHQHRAILQNPADPGRERRRAHYRQDLVANARLATRFLEKAERAAIRCGDPDAWLIVQTALDSLAAISAGGRISDSGQSETAASATPAPAGTPLTDH